MFLSDEPAPLSAENGSYSTDSRRDPEERIGTVAIYIITQRH